jgi:hypothetical protein
MADLVEVRIFNNVYGKIYFTDFPLDGEKEIIVVLPYKDNGKIWAQPIIGQTSMSGKYFIKDRIEEPVLLTNNSIPRSFLDTLINLVANTNKKEIENEHNFKPTWNEASLDKLDGCYSELKEFLIEFEKRLNVEQYPECRAIKEALEHFRRNNYALAGQMQEIDETLKQELKEKGITQ